jgi:hypothetical protein
MEGWILDSKLLAFHAEEQKDGRLEGQTTSTKVAIGTKPSRWQKKTPGVSAMQTNADENGTRTRATFVTRKYVKITLTWRHNQLGHLTYEFDVSYFNHSIYIVMDL